MAKKALFSANVKLKPSHMDEEREMKGPFRRLIPDLGLSVWDGAIEGSVLCFILA